MYFIRFIVVSLFVTYIIIIQYTSYLVCNRKSINAREIYSKKSRYIWKMVEKYSRGWSRDCVFPVEGRSRRRNITPQSQICNIFFKKYDNRLLIYTSKGLMSRYW